MGSTTPILQEAAELGEGGEGGEGGGGHLIPI